MNDKKLKNVLEKHQKWLNNENGGERANLRYANLGSANLHSANLRSANMYYANLGSADLHSADLRSANLRYADLRYANLHSANLRSANMYYANLGSADLHSANLDDDTIKNINTYRPFQICPQEGEFIAWKKGSDGCLIKILIPKTAKRTSSLVGRKCRASKVKVLAIWDKDNKPVKECGGWKTLSFQYRVNRISKEDSYDPDIRVECTHGIHFFITKEEAEAWQ